MTALHRLVWSTCAAVLFHLGNAHRRRAPIEPARYAESSDFPPITRRRKGIKQRVADMHARPMACRRSKEVRAKPREAVVAMHAASGRREHACLERRQFSVHLTNVER